jgi:hypothetical protein
VDITRIYMIDIHTGGFKVIIICFVNTGGHLGFRNVLTL